MPDPNDILLEAGTNEFEVLVFRLATGSFGVNVAKVREVIRWHPPHETPQRHASVLGMINLRGQVLAVVDLRKHLSLGACDATHRDTRIVVTEFNGVRTGFAVDAVEQIHRIGWSAVKPAPDIDHLSADQTAGVGICTGVVELGGRLVLMLDFESVADAIMADERLHVGSIPNPQNIDRASKSVVMAEDSPFVRELVGRVFRDSGYTNIELHANGRLAWDALEKRAAEGRAPDIVISDIEMPEMDGLNLCRRIKDAGAPLASTPVILFSSLVSEDNKKKGEQVGADAQIPKPGVAEMVHMVDGIVTGQGVDASISAISGAGAAQSSAQAA